MGLRRVSESKEELAEEDDEQRHRRGRSWGAVANLMCLQWRVCRW